MTIRDKTTPEFPLDTFSLVQTDGQTRHEVVEDQE
jgi:hypothetical protein